MLNVITRKIFGKELIIYNRHRNTIPLLNEDNLSKFIFINYLPFWKLTRLFGRNTRARYRAMAMILSVVRPVYIIDIDWITKLGGLYCVWSRNSCSCTFIVVQHGLYIGGVITDKAHRYSKCDLILSWGQFSLNEFEKYNSKKKVKIIEWGNPLYNQSNRGSIKFSTKIGNRILVAPTLIKGSRKKELEDFLVMLTDIGFDVSVKEHKYQPSLSEHIACDQRVHGDLYEILLRQEFDIIISDTSTTLIDALYFKNRALFFSPDGELPEFTLNAYSKYMRNIAAVHKSFTSRDDVLACIDLDAQERLLDIMVTIGDNDLTKLEAI